MSIIKHQMFVIKYEIMQQRKLIGFLLILNYFTNLIQLKLSPLTSQQIQFVNIAFLVDLFLYLSIHIIHSSLYQYYPRLTFAMQQMITRQKPLSFTPVRKFIIVLALILSIGLEMCNAAPQDDKIAGIPGYPEDFNASVYSGYLKTSSDKRLLHYVFIENYKGAKNVLPVLLWMNGGPGCSSKIGLLQQVAPYLLPLTASYQTKQDLVLNPYSWLNLTNLLFIDNPAGVGYSINNDQTYVHNDKNTAQDTMDALANFFAKFPEYLPNPFYISGESYAGKYIPDLTLQIYNYNSMNKNTTINIKGILLGNPAINFRTGSLEDSEIEFMNTHHFIDPKIYPNWKGACHTDPKSAGCQFFYARYEQLLKRIDFYNIYGPCLDGKVHDSQAGYMKMSAKNFSRLDMQASFPWQWTQFSQCFNDKPINDYFSINHDAFKVNSSSFTVCNSSVYQAYDISETGSITQLQALIGINQIKVYFFSGDFDDVIPFTDTVKNLERMGLKPDGMQTPLKIREQHVGFVRSYKDKKNVKLFIIKGAGHEAVAYKPETAYAMLQMFLATS